MNVLVTGHRGYIGSVLVPALRQAGHSVTGLDCDYYRSCGFGQGTAPALGITKDIRDVEISDLEGIEAIIHLAGLSNDPLGDLSPELTEDINTRATLRLAKLAKAAGVQRFVFSSSCSNYGAANDDWLTEESTVNPVTPYAVSKVNCEAGLDRLADHTFSPVYLRSGTAYGMSPRIRFDLVVNNLTAWAIASGQVRLKSDGCAWRPLVHAEDMAQAFLLALTAPRNLIHRQAFNVGRNDDCMQIRDIAEIVQRAIPQATITFAQDRIIDTRNYRVDCSKIEILGFVPKWTLQRGVEQLRDTFRERTVNVADFEGEKYQRVAHIRSLIARGELDETLRRVTAVAA